MSGALVWLRRLIVVLGSVAGVLLLIMTAITFIDVVGRYLFDRPIAIAFELVQIVMGTLVLAALPLVTAQDAHVNMGLFVERLRGRMRIAQRLIAYGICSALSIMWGLYVFRTAAQLSGYGERLTFSGIPVGPFAYFFAIMIFFSAGLLLLVAVLGPLSDFQREDEG